MLWKMTPPAVRTFTRMCSRKAKPHNNRSTVGFFDIHSQTLPNILDYGESGVFILPKSTYAACWVYPRYILKVLKNSSNWETTEAKYTTATGLNAIRELQSKPLQDRALVPLDLDFRIPFDTYVWHLGGSGQLHCSEYCSYSLQHQFIAKRFVYLINTRKGTTPFIDGGHQVPACRRICLSLG